MQRFARAGSAEELLGKATSRESKLDKFKPYLASGGTKASPTPPRCTPNCSSAAGPAACRPSAATSGPFRQAAAAPGPAAVPKTRQITRWLLTRPDHLQADEQAQLEASPRPLPAHRRARRARDAAFAEMMTARTGSRDLEAWLAAVEADEPARPALLRRRHPQRQASRHQRPHLALQLRQGRGHRQQDQDDQAPDVRPRRLRPASQTRHLAPCITGSQNSRQSRSL